MPVTVECFAAYLTITPESDEWIGDEEWRGAGYDAKKFVDAVKGKPVNGYATIPYGGKLHRVDQSRRRVAVDLFGRWAAEQRAPALAREPCMLVPVPSSNSTVTAPARGAAVVLAEAVAKHAGSGAEVRDCLRWTREVPPAHEGGPRRAAILYPHLACAESVRGRKCVLLDDVLTSGGHLQACAARLRQEGAVVDLALCAGRTWRYYPLAANPFELEAERLDDYVPP
ncbi:MAG: hypothetical protein ACT4PV_11715 [Planctomycetaceae bacterium]